MNQFAKPEQRALSDDAALMPEIEGNFLMGFWHNWPSEPGNGYQGGQSADLPLAEAPADYNIVAVAFMKGAGIPTFKPYNLSDQAFREQVGELNRQGRAVLISLGGADAHIELHAGQEQALADEIIRLVETYGFDGLDIDLEQSAIAAADNSAVIPAALKRVKDHYAAQGRHFIISMAPEFPYLKVGDKYAPYLAALDGYYDFIAPQYYNQGGDGVWVDELNAWLSQDNQEQKEDFLYYLTDSLVNGTRGFLRIPADKFAIGLPANNDAAATGFVADPGAVYRAFSRLAADGNPIRGLMTWSVNWDAGHNAEGRPYDWGFVRDYAELIHGCGEGGRPGAPQNLKVDSRSDTAISLSWEASQGGEHAVTHYQLHRDDQPAGETSALNYLDSGLRPGTAYRYFVTALDAEGQASGPSNSVTASTTGGDPGPEFPEWLNEHDYQVGDGVSYQGLHYRCLQAHRSNPGWTPDVAFTLWGLA